LTKSVSCARVWGDGWGVASEAVIEALLRDGEEVTVKRLYREEAGRVRLRPENRTHEELVLPSEDVRVQECVLYVVHPPNERADRGGA
jgi:repressor LexA